MFFRGLLEGVETVQSALHQDAELIPCVATHSWTLSVSLSLSACLSLSWGSPVLPVLGTVPLLPELSVYSHFCGSTLPQLHTEKYRSIFYKQMETQFYPNMSTHAIRLNPTPRREKGEKVTDALPLALPKGGLPRVFLIFLLKSHLCNIFHNQRKRIKGRFSEGPLAVTFALRTCLAPLPAQGNSSHS